MLYTNWTKLETFMNYGNFVLKKASDKKKFIEFITALLSAFFYCYNKMKYLYIHKQTSKRFGEKKNKENSSCSIELSNRFNFVVLHRINWWIVHKCHSRLCLVRWTFGFFVCHIREIYLWWYAFDVCSSASIEKLKNDLLLRQTDKIKHFFLNAFSLYKKKTNLEQFFVHLMRIYEILKICVTRTFFLWRTLKANKLLMSARKWKTFY